MEEGEISLELKEEKIKQEDLLIEAKNFFEAHKKELLESSRRRNNVIILNFEDLIKFSKVLSDQILENPEKTLRIFEQAIEQSPLVDTIRLRLDNLPKTQEVKIRNIRSKHLNEIVVIDGLIRQASDVRPKVVNAKFECPSCATIISALQIEKKFREPSRCSCGQRGRFKLISKEMVDIQKLVVEESPDSLSGGEQPKRIDIFVQEDLVEPKMEEKTTPGAKIKVIGILKEIPILLPSGGLSTRFGLAIEANNIIPLEETFEELNTTDEDERQILELSKDPNIIDKLAKSIAPSIWGYEEIKKALILQLFSGVKKEMSDGSHSRGDIHILLVGDPGVAKSVILGFMANIAPKGRYVVGRSTSGAGLTATVVRDEYLKGWTLEAGAMVLANKGLVCIDELEKMDPQDRSAMHEAMEQQTVTISKANVQATLRAATSVLAAANPKFGTFNQYEPVPEQIDLPPTLINRFDIIFTLKDLPNKDKDEKIATHVLQEHIKDTDMTLIPKELLRKYIAYSKQRIIPKLSKEAIDELKNFYVELRSKPVHSESALKPVPISARQLQALIRMSEAAAKVKLSDTVSRENAKQSIEIMKHYLMQVGYDYELQQFDIGRISTGIASSQRNKIFAVKETIIALSKKIGKEIPIEEIKNDLKDRMDEQDIYESIEKLLQGNEIWRPKHGFIGVF